MHLRPLYATPVPLGEVQVGFLPHAAALVFEPGHHLDLDLDFFLSEHTP